ncbi:MAG: Gldg family protein [Faecalibacterium prausnitzii]
MKWNKNAASQKGRVFRSGLLSTAMLAAVLVLAVLLNLLVRAIPAKYTEFDLSEAKMYTLSDSTKALVEGLEKDVHIYYLCETGSEDTIITKLLDHYAAESGHLSWEQKDPTLYPTFAAKYGAENVSTGSLIVTCGENSTVLDAADLYEYDYSDYYTTGSASVTFGGEKQITSAIYKLTSAEQSHAYYTTNHGEQTLTDSLTDALDAQNIDAQPLDLLTSTIPEDCDLLIINAPTTDFSAGDGLVDEISQLQNYLAAGGKLLLTSSVYAQTPQLDAVLAQFGLARAEGMVVEGDSSKALYNSAWSLLPDYGTYREHRAERREYQYPCHAVGGAGHHGHRDRGCHRRAAAEQLLRCLCQNRHQRPYHHGAGGRERRWPLCAGCLGTERGYRCRGSLDRLSQHG